MNLRSLFYRNLGQTSPAPLALEIVKADGCILTGADGKEYIDLIGGISVANVGHRHPKVVDAIKTQVDAYMHVMVYGEFIQSPQVRYAKALADHLPKHLNSVYFTNSGAEAVEGAMKLAKRATGRTGIIAFKNSYHGSTQGALSIIGDEYWRNAYRPLLPDVHHLDFNSFGQLEKITMETACVIVETVQAEAGVVEPDAKWMKALREKCNETGSLLILDEIQAGFGRTGTTWAFEKTGIEPDVLLLGKALGGGLPLGAFITEKSKMDLLSDNPVLGHITTFGGHPVSCAAGLAAFEALLEENMVGSIREKERLLAGILTHPRIKKLNHCGLWFAVHLENETTAKKVVDHCITNGVITDWFLFAQNAIRISPPLTITQDQLRTAAGIILKGLD